MIVTSRVRFGIALCSFLGGLAGLIWTARAYIKPGFEGQRKASLPAPELPPPSTPGLASTPALAPALAPPSAPRTPTVPLFYPSEHTLTTLPTSPAPKPPGKLFSVELKAVDSQKEAHRLVSMFESQGVKVFYTPLQRTDGSMIYRIRKGVFADLAKAKGESTRLQQQLNIDTRVISLQ